MSLLHSPPPPSDQELAQAAPSTNVVKCVICCEDMSEFQEILVIATCNHEFHRNCIESLLSQSAECPYCKKSCDLADLTMKKTEFHLTQNSPKPQKQSIQARGKPRGAMAKKYNTRGASKNLIQEFAQVPLAESAPNDLYLVTENYAVNSPMRNNAPSYMTRNHATPAPHNVPCLAPNFPQGRDLQPTFDYTQLNQFIENTLTRLLGNLNMAPNNHQQFPQNNRSNSQPSCQPDLQNSARINMCTNSATNHPIREEPFAMRAEKITSIIQNWNLKFDGSTNGLNVEEFLYRVRSLTTENFNGDFGIICKNLHILLVGKARDWYWRYHKQVTNIDWREFCQALRYQYKDFRSNFDLKEEIRNRKMKPGEKFETFFESVCVMLDRLETPIPETELVEILTRNLRSDIRHELLYVPIYSIAHLRKLVQMRENLLGEEYFRRNLPSKQTTQFYSRRNIAEVDAAEDYPELTITSDATVDAIRTGPVITNCWNCGEPGHHWEDCLRERKVFCYGCGAKNTYKPQCQRCSNRKIINSKNSI